MKTSKTKLKKTTMLPTLAASVKTAVLVVSTSPSSVVAPALAHPVVKVPTETTKMYEFQLDSSTFCFDLGLINRSLPL